MIGISAQPPTTVDLFAAYLQHNMLSAISYSAVYSQGQHHTKRSQQNLQTASNTNLITALYDVNYNKAYTVFWGQRLRAVDRFHFQYCIWLPHSVRSITDHKFSDEYR